MDLQRFARTLLALLLIGTVAVVAEELEFDTAGRVDYSDGALSVSFDSVALNDALRQTGEATGVSFSVNHGSYGWVTANFTNLALETAIQRLLTGYNYMLLYQQAKGTRRISKVVVMGRVRERASPIEASAVTSPAAAAQVPARQAAQIVLRRRSNSNYIASGFINAQPVEFLIDTGATTVAVSSDLANNLGLRYGVAKSIETANGRTTGFETTLRSVELGGLKVDNIRAIIMPDLSMSKRVLLGMNFLETFEIIQRNGELIIRQYNP